MFLKKRIPVYVTLLIVLSLGALFYWEFNRVVYASKVSVSSISRDCPPLPVVRYTSSGYSLVNPLLFGDSPEESKNLTSLKSKIEQIINHKKETGEVTAASVYLRILNKSEWLGINDNEVYYPASLVKVPVLMVYLHASEKNPSLLNKELYLDKGEAAQLPSQTFNDTKIEPGKKYKIGFLLNRMIVNSDNAATYLLNTNLDISEFKKLFVDLGLPEPDVHDPKYSINASGYSRFFRVLYNATYLSKENSELALSLLSQGDFRDGIVKTAPSGLIVAHKFGEYGERVPGGKFISQLHETGIFYYKGNPYLLTVMTRGTNIQVLPKTLSDISSEVLNYMN